MVEGSGFMVQGSGFRVQGAGCRVHPKELMRTMSPRMLKEDAASTESRHVNESFCASNPASGASSYLRHIQ